MLSTLASSSPSDDEDEDEDDAGDSGLGEFAALARSTVLCSLLSSRRRRWWCVPASSSSLSLTSLGPSAPRAPFSFSSRSLPAPPPASSPAFPLFRPISLNHSNGRSPTRRRTFLDSLSGMPSELSAARALFRLSSMFCRIVSKNGLNATCGTRWGVSALGLALVPPLPSPEEAQA